MRGMMIVDKTVEHTDAWYNRVSALALEDPAFLGALHASWAFQESEEGRTVQEYFLSTGDFHLTGLDPELVERFRAHEENHQRETDAAILRAMDQADAEGLV